jgi:hypothetical protein
MSQASKHWSRLASVGVLWAGGLCGACSTPSDSEIAEGTGGAGGAGGSAPATGGSSATGGTATGGSGGSQTGGSSQGGSGGSSAGQSAGGSSSANGGAAGGGAGGTAGSAGKPSSGGSTSGDGGTSSGSAGQSSSECMPKSTLTVGMHIVMNISWPDTLATTKGTGQFHLWNLIKYDVDGTKLTGELKACGSVLPPIELSTIAGGGKALIEIPDIWDEPSMPRFEATGTLSGWSPGAEFKGDPTPALVGLTLADAMATWPAKGIDIETVDADGDMKPGLTGTSKSDAGFVRAPTSILGQLGPVTDLVYLVTRTTAGHNATLSSCTEASGTSEVTYFDNHVVGCHVYNGDECDETQADFIDSNRTIYVVSSATSTAKFIDDSASCADVRAALPQ